MNSVSNLLVPENILLDVAVANKARLFEVIGQHMEQAYSLDKGWVADSLTRREKAGSTGLGHGVAIPHARIDGLEKIRVLYIRLKPPILFGAPDRQPVSDVVVLLVPNPAAEEHLTLLADAVRLLSDENFRKALSRCDDAAEIKRLFDDWPAASA